MYTYILLICVLSLAARGLTDDVELSPVCREEFIRQAQLRDQCHSRLPIEKDNFLDEFNTTVLAFSGNDEDLPVVEAFFSKHCEVMPSFLQCSDLSDDVSAECQLQIPNRQMKLFFFQGVSSVIQYACDNDADMLKKLVPHDGFRFLILNEDFERCIAVFKNLEAYSDVCLTIDKSIPCFEEVVGDHPNEDIIVFVREIINRFKSAANCGN